MHIDCLKASGSSIAYSLYKALLLRFPVLDMSLYKCGLCLSLALVLLSASQQPKPPWILNKSNRDNGSLPSLPKKLTRWWFQRFFTFTPILGEMIQFGHEHIFSNCVVNQPPTRESCYEARLIIRWSGKKLVFLVCVFGNRLRRVPYRNKWYHLLWRQRSLPP